MRDLMSQTNNYFERTAESGTYSIVNGSIALRGTYKVGQYVRILDSLLNDGVYKITAIADKTVTLDGTTTDEVFTGYIVGLAVPSDFIALAEKVKKFNKHQGIASESIPNYTISFSANNGYTAYANEIARYNKPYIARYYFLNWVESYDAG